MVIPVILVSCAVAFCGTDAATDGLQNEADANVRTDSERTLVLYEQRLAEYARKRADVSELFQPADGIDQFEALLLAKAYFLKNFGLCGVVGLPEKVAGEWIVAMSVGLPCKPTSNAIIDAGTGRLRCEGHPDVTDPLAYIKGIQW